MFKYRTWTLFFLLTFFISHQTVFLSADDILLPEEESSSTFLEAQRNSDDVSLFLAGSWKVDFSAATGFGWNADSGFDNSTYYSGITTGISFSQSPDITISLLILNHYIFEAAFTDEFEDSTFMLGYRGGEEDFVQSISAGNMGINISEQIESSDYFMVPDGGSSSFGIHTALSGPLSYHELLLRFDPQEEQEKIYIGSDSVTETELEVHDYLKSRFFYVPGSPSDAVFYIETEEDQAELTEDDGRFYKELASDEFSYSTSDGLLYLESEAKASILVKSSSTDWSVESPDAETVNISGTEMLRLFEPGIFSTFESAAAYGLYTVLPTDSSKTRVYLALDADNTDSGTELSTDLINDDGIVIIEPSAGGSDKYPLEGIIENSESVYGENSLPSSYVIEQRLIFRIREESTSYSIDDPVSGTIRIFINGIENFEWTESGGTISFETDPGSDDRIVITYRKDTDATTTGDILFASGNSFNIGENWTADLNAGLRLNLSNGYSLPGEETSAYGEVAAGISYDSSKNDTENADDKIIIKGELTAGLKLLTENASGTLLLKDMSDGSLDVTLNSDSVFPGSMSESEEISPALEESDRGLLLYKDYRVETGSSSYYLLDYNSTDFDDNMIFSPEDSPADDKYQAGPYTTAAVEDGRSGEILAMDYILEDENSWTSVQIPISSGTDNLDLSAYNALSFDCKAEEDLTDVSLYLEIGSLSEDLDGDKILDAETSAYSSGYTFNDPNSEAGTLIGGDNLYGNNGELDSEDINDNGFLDVEKTDAAAFFEISTMPDTDWQRVNFYFTDATGTAARSRLKNAEFIRITVVNTSASENSGRILFDDFSFEGASMFASDDDDYSAPEFSEVDESQLSDAETPDEDLTATTIDTDDDNDVLRISWKDDEAWKLYSYISPISADEYGSIIFYIMTPSLAASGTESMQLSFNLTDSDDKGVKALIPLTEGEAWQEVEIRTKTGDILIDGESSSLAELSVDSDADLLNLIEIETKYSSEGILLIDEIQLTNPSLHAVTGIAGNFEADFTEPLWKVGDSEIIGPAVIKAEASADVNTDTEELAGGLFQAAAEYGSISAAGELETTVLSAPVSIDLSWTSGGTTNAGHNIEFPFFNKSVVIEENFNTNDISGEDFSKTNRMLLNTDLISGTIAGFSTSLDSTLLVREWNSELNSNLAPFSLGLSADFLLSDYDHLFSCNNYFTGWYESTALAVDFSTASLLQRKTTFSITPSINTNPLGFSSDITLSTDIDDEANADNTADIVLSLPLTFGSSLNPVNASIGYSRSGSFSYNSSSDNFGSDISSMLKTFSARQYLYSSIPFYELFDSSLPDLIFSDCSAGDIDESSFENTFSASVSRNYSSRLVDLLLPYSFEFSLNRTIGKDFNDIEDDLDLYLIWRNAALNLFGSAGAYPLFNFYFSDELSWSVETSVSNPFSSEAEQEYLINTGFSLFGHDDDIFSIDSSVYLPLNIEDESTSIGTELIYVWNQYPETSIDLPLFTAEDEESMMITHEENLSLNYDEIFSSELRHTTSLIIPQRFTLSAFGLAGFEINDLSENITALFGLSFGISGSIIY